MRNARAIWILALSMLIGLAVTAMAVNWVSQKGVVSLHKVVVATTDIALGSKLTPQMLTLVDWPSDAVPASAFSDIKELQDRVTRTAIDRGEAILKSKLAPAGTLGGLSAVIADGKRAMTVRVNDVVGVAGFALPGNFVDIMVNTQQESQAGGERVQAISKIVLEHVLVLAVAQESGRDETRPRVVSAVTLELSIEDAEKLDLARNIGTLSLVLRNQVDKQAVATTGVTKQQLFGGASRSPAPVPAVDAGPSPVQAPRQARRSGNAPVIASLSNCVEVFHNNTSALNCF